MAPCWNRRQPRDSLPLAVCAGVVLIAHGVALTLADGKPLRRTSATPGAAASSLQAIAVRPLAAVDTLRPARDDAEPIGRDAAPAGERAAAAVAQATGAAALDAASRADGTVAAAVRFYRFAEVDAAAEPRSQWNVALETLDAAGLERVAFDVWIDERGRILACSLLGAEGLDPAVRRALETRLMTTELVPAIRDGVDVASHRRVEIYVDAGDTSGYGR